MKTPQNAKDDGDISEGFHDVARRGVVKPKECINVYMIEGESTPQQRHIVKCDGYVVGVDEAGRGPWAGPVYAAAVILPEHHSIPGIKDSKKLSAAAREQLFSLITEQALDYAIAKAEVIEIDTLNILNATLLAMERAIRLLKLYPTEILIDGNCVPKISGIHMRAIVKGDALIPTISAASILAKVARDREMLAWHATHPEYGFAQHKGYGTQSHRDALLQHGVSSLHRRSFKPIRELLQSNCDEK